MARRVRTHRFNGVKYDAAKWSLSEEDVTRMAGEITDLAWRFGFRRI